MTRKKTVKQIFYRKIKDISQCLDCKIKNLASNFVRSLCKKVKTHNYGEKIRALVKKVDNYGRKNKSLDFVLNETK